MFQQQKSIKFSVQINVGQKEMLVTKNYFCNKKYWSTMTASSNMITMSTILFWSKLFFGKKSVGQKKFWSKKMLVKQKCQPCPQFPPSQPCTPTPYDHVHHDLHDHVRDKHPL